MVSFLNSLSASKLHPSFPGNFMHSDDLSVADILDIQKAEIERLLKCFSVTTVTTGNDVLRQPLCDKLEMVDVHFLVAVAAGLI